MLRSFMAASLLILSSACLAAEPPTLNVWPDKAPGETKEIGPEEYRPPQPNQKSDVKRLTNVSQPTLTVFQPAHGKGNGTGVIICPGGGYSILAWDLEGTEVAEWLNTLGSHGVRAQVSRAAA
jgi:hypothetical protein